MCSLAQTTPMAAVEVLMEFFCTRLLLKRYRKGNREGPVPMEVRACEAEFRALATRAVVEVEQGAPLDAMVWCDLCSGFSAEWMTAAHWVSPKKFREHLTSVLGAAWTREEEIPEEREQPPVDLKWYKANDGTQSAQRCMCVVCDVQCNSMAQYRAHAQGRMHKVNARQWSRQNHGRAVQPLMLPNNAAYPAAQVQQQQQQSRMAGTLPPSQMEASMGQHQLQPPQDLSLPMSMQTSESTLGQTMNQTHMDVLRVESTLSLMEVGTPMAAAASTPPSTASTPVYYTGQTGPYLQDVPPSRMLSFSSFAASSEADTNESFDALPLASRRSSALDAMYPVPARSLSTASVDSVTCHQVRQLDSALARLACGGGALEKARMLAVSLLGAGAEEEVLHSLVDAAVHEGAAAGVAQVAAALAHMDADFRDALAEAVEGLAEHGHARATDDEEAFVASCEFYEAKTRTRHAGLVRLVGELVCLDVLPAGALLTCVAVALADPTAEDVANAFSALARGAESAGFTAEDAGAAQELFAAATASMHLPRYVRELVAPLVEA
eukprot:TRINITY_DN348_c0_g1_i1.p2 TRINITY_DN348_c0_g1~~TRINITY_DN348_c0_g1_i1.p2  ORF type:complete len:552 (+),score=304.32 TRINITY_DN348_c0_g1_i1:75-1730(+)